MSLAKTELAVLLVVQVQALALTPGQAGGTPEGPACSWALPLAPSLLVLLPQVSGASQQVAGPRKRPRGPWQPSDCQRGPSLGVPHENLTMVSHIDKSPLKVSLPHISPRHMYMRIFGER